MRHIAIPAVAACLLGLPGAAISQTSPLPLPLPSADAPSPASDFKIEWEVKNRFRLFRSEADFQHHAAAFRGDGVLAAEMRLAQASDGRGWARDMVERTCTDQSGRLPETCQRDGERENYLSPQDHRIGVLLAGNVPAGATCHWNFADSEVNQKASAPCAEEIKLRVRYGRTTAVTVDAASPDGAVQRAQTEIAVRDLMIAGMGDSIAAGEGNPDRPVALADSGFCFRRFLGGTLSEYFRPGRANFKGDKACDQAATNASAAATASAEWARSNALWFSTACHRSLYSYQTRTALALAIQNPHIAITYLPLACSGASIDIGIFGAQRARECPSTGNCATTVPPQLARLTDALTLARRSRPDRRLDLVLLTVGANDIYFSGLVAHAIVEAGTERSLFENGGMITTIPESQRLLDRELPADFQKLRNALKPIVGGNLARVVFVSYGHPALQPDGTPCQSGRAGFDVHPAFNADPDRMRQIASYVSEKFLPKMRSLALCEGGVVCRDLDNDRMTFVDQHQQAFTQHGMCAASEQDPAFDRECFSAKGESFESNPAEAATGPLVCPLSARDFRPYASRSRWIRTANDSYFTAMTYPIGPSPGMQPSDIHDATWGAMSAVYGGAVHPTAEGHAAMADAALPAARAVLGLPDPGAIRSEPLPPPPPEPAPANQ